MKFNQRRNFIIIFFIIISIPFILIITSFKGVVKVKENRILVAAPSLPKTFYELRYFLPSLDKYIGDHFGLRNEFLLLNEYLILKILKTSTSDSVFLGENDWLFFGGGNLANYRNSNLFTDNEIDAWVAYIKQNQKNAELIGAKYIFMITPDSHTINGEENLPKWFVKRQRFSKFDQLKNELKLQGINLLDVRDQLKEKSKSQQLYYKNDTHWTVLGAYYAYRDLMKYLGIEPIAYDKFSIETVDADRSDMQEMLGPIGTKEKITVLKKKFPEQYKIKFGKIDQDLNVVTECEVCKNKDKVLIFRDSYFIGLFPFVSEHFRTIHYSSRNGIDWSIVKDEMPNYIIEQIVERNFSTFKPVIHKFN